MEVRSILEKKAAGDKCPVLTRCVKIYCDNKWQLTVSQKSDIDELSEAMEAWINTLP